MPGFYFPSLLCIALCVHYATAQWSERALSKGITCDHHCTLKVHKCDPMVEYQSCKCFPKLLVDTWLQYNTLPIDPNVVCRMSWIGMVPKCCDFYKQHKDSYMKGNKAEELTKKLATQEEQLEELNASLSAKEDQMNECENKFASKEEELGKLKKACDNDKSVLPSNQTASSNEDQVEELTKELTAKEDELEKLKEKLGSCENSKNLLSPNLTADLVSLIVAQNRNQDEEIAELKERLESEHDEKVRLSKLTDDIVNTINEQNRSQSSEIEQLKGDIDSTKDTVFLIINKTAEEFDNQGKDIEKLEETIATERAARTRLSNLTAELLGSLGEENRNQEKALANIEKKLTSQRADISNDISTQNSELKHLEQVWSTEPWKPYCKKLIDDSAADSGDIGFTAYRSTDMEVTVGHTIVFNVVVTNVGGAYNPNNGLFKCPKDGVYVFSFSICVFSGQSIDAELIVNNIDLLSAYGVARTNYYLQSSNTAVVKLKKNDYVQVRHNPAHQTQHEYANVEGSSKMRLTSFTGFLLHG